jgi:hypothetical protein
VRTPTAAQGGAADDVRSDVQRVLRLTEEIHRQVTVDNARGSDARRGGVDDAPGVASTLALAGAGVLVGFVLGAAYGRRQERNRRTRVRF